MELHRKLGYQLLATPGTRRVLLDAGISEVTEASLEMGREDSLYKYMAGDSLALVINTTDSRKRSIDPTHLRRLVLTYNVPYCTTLQAALALVNALEAMGTEREFTYEPLRGYDAATKSQRN